VRRNEQALSCARRAEVVKASATRRRNGERAQLHPAADCFSGVGYRVEPLPLKIDEAGARWGSFSATRGADRLRVTERIYSDAGGGWTDVSAWYWSAAAGDAAGPWWAATVAEREVEREDGR
jgi:hypothetical protein